MQDSSGGAPQVIGRARCDSYTIEPGSATAGLILLCDHACNAFPPGYGTLGLPREQLQRHIAYDIGAREVTVRLARLIGAPAVMTHYSRLLIDPNRGLDDPTLIMRLSDGAIIPGNRQLDAPERDKRIRLYYEPYHRAIAGLIDTCLAAGRRPAILSIHSFTDNWKGVPRPWHAGVLWDQDRRFSGPLIKALEGVGTLVVGDNEPYSGRLKGDTMWRHGTMRDLPHALIEVRQDLIGDEAGQQAWADLLGKILLDMQVRCGELGFALSPPAAGAEPRRRRDQAALTTAEDYP